MINVNMKTGLVCIDTTSISSYEDVQKLPNVGVDSVYTSISSNNDFLVAHYLKKLDQFLLITELSDPNPKLLEYLISNHLDALGLPLNRAIDVLTINADLINEEVINAVSDCELINDIGVSCPKNVDQLKSIVDIPNAKIKYVSLPCCPLNYNYDVISWCKEHGILIIGLNPFGDEFSRPCIEDSFSRAYLSEFLFFNSDIMCIPADDSQNVIAYLDSPDLVIANETKYELKKNICKVVKPFKKVVNTYLNIRGEVVPVDDNKRLIPGGFKSTLGKVQRELRNLSELSGIEKDVLMQIPVYDTDEIPNPYIRFAMYRYKILSILQNIMPTSHWNYNSLILSKNIHAISISRKLSKISNWTKRDLLTSYDFLIYSCGTTDRGIIKLDENKD